MVKKIKEYLKGKNPYLAASATIVIVSVAIICLMLKEEVSTEQNVDMVSTEVVQGMAEETDTSMIHEESIVEETENLEETNESVSEVPDVSEMQETEESESVSDTNTEPDGDMVAEPETVATQEPENATEHEKKAEPEILPEPENTPEPIVIPEPEIAPEESIEDAEKTEQKEASESETPPDDAAGFIPTPEPVEIPAADAHEHSWIFESYYQEPTCSNGGLVNQICAHCGETQITPGTPTGKHVYEIESAGDCCSAEIVVCKDCNHRETGEKDPKNHIDVEDGFCYGCGQKTS